MTKLLVSLDLESFKFAVGSIGPVSKGTVSSLVNLYVSGPAAAMTISAMFTAVWTKSSVIAAVRLVKVALTEPIQWLLNS